MILLAGGPGFEPRLPGPEPGVLPLNYPPSATRNTTPDQPAATPGPTAGAARPARHQQNDHPHLGAMAKIAATVRASPSCHGGRRSPNTAASLPQSSRESGGRFALVGHSAVATGTTVGIA